jgi:S-adenosylmethionine:tRNA ribosyltransferase-isomerase
MLLNYLSGSELLPKVNMESPKNISISEFTYTLPEEKIAVFPLEERDASKMLVYRDGNITDMQFRDLSSQLEAGDLLIFNHTRVVQARLQFLNRNGGRIEVFCLEPAGELRDIPTAMLQRRSADWICLVGHAKKWKDGEVLQLQFPETDFALSATLKGREGDAFRVHFGWNDEDLCFADVLEKVGNLPLPPYLKREAMPDDKDRYQTVYAREKGSVAAPTAGLHFTDRVFESLISKGIDTAYLTLHVGAGTFKPVKAATMEGHQMHEEEVIVSLELIRRLAQCKGRIIAVGTTSLRSLESLFWTALRINHQADAELCIQVGQWEPYNYDMNSLPSFSVLLENLAKKMEAAGIEVLKGHTGLMVAPSYRIQTSQMLITNFHQPESTLLLLVSAFIGDDWRKMYAHALSHGYRFLSYGDSSLLHLR